MIVPLLLLGLILLTVVAPLLSRLPGWVMQARLQQAHAKARLLTQARQTSLDYAIGAVRSGSSSKTYPGKLPMPDFDGDGASDGPIGISGSRVCMGFYPWKMLPASWQPAEGERLRMAVAERVINPQQGNVLEITARDWRRATWLSVSLPDRRRLDDVVALLVLEPSTSSVTEAGTNRQCDYPYPLDLSSSRWAGRYRVITLPDFLDLVVHQVAKRLMQAWPPAVTIVPETQEALRLAVAGSSLNPTPGSATVACSSSQWWACWLDTIDDYRWHGSSSQASFTFEGCKTRFTLHKPVSSSSVEIRHDGETC